MTKHWACFACQLSYQRRNDLW